MANLETETEIEPSEAQRYQDLPPAQTFVLLLSIAVVALCGIVYELIIGTISSYLLGNSVYQFSLTIGFFMFAMGIGSYLSKFLHGNLVRNFVYVEIVWRWSVEFAALRCSSHFRLRLGSTKP